MKHVFNYTISFCLLALLFIQSCTTEEAFLTQQEQIIQTNEVLERIASMGYNVDNVIELEDGYLIEGDLKFSKNINDYVSSQRTTGGGLQLISNTYMYKVANLFGTNEVDDIRIYSEISQNVFGDPWFDAINQAIGDWNSSGSCAHLSLTNVESEADIKIVASYQGPFGWVDLPLDGAIIRTVFINMNYQNGITTANEKRNIIAHELGHCLGFGHNNFVSSANTPIPNLVPEATSIMDGGILTRTPTAIGITTNDEAALRYLYDPLASCGISTGPIALSPINGPSSVCSTGRPSTYTWGGTGTVTWEATSNLSLSNITGTSVRVLGTSTGTGTLTAKQNGNIVGSKTIQITTPPTPNQAPVISGPSLLKYYQTGFFYTSSNNFTNYSDVDWVVFSYDFPNAGQYFQVQTSPTATEFSTTVEVLPTAPEGVYTVQCRVSNSCGTYYIDREFTVQAGPPQLFP